MVISEFDKRVLKAKSDFLIIVSKFEILFITNTSLALLRRQGPNNLRYTILYMYATQILENVAFFFINSPKIRTIKCRTETSTQFNKHIFATFVKHPKSRFDLQYNSLICLNISVASLLLLLNIYPRYLIKSVYDIDKELKCSDGKVNFYNFGVNATQYDFNALKFISIPILYS